ncbi:hypothetical protein [Clostridium paraputrificum]|uniref:hypothetical protein n=1 Tax=Clostridium paraputrificum TaxID=29363 RepID=UPI0006C06BFA|nr:hypothetical protein [Clostridium paraputrificum]CUO20103.1 Uncharacterised protein [Clostridium paraputrificum]
MKSKLLAIFIIFNFLFILGCNRNNNASSSNLKLYIYNIEKDSLNYISEVKRQNFISWNKDSKSFIFIDNNDDNYCYNVESFSSEKISSTPESYLDKSDYNKLNMLSPKEKQELVKSLSIKINFLNLGNMTVFNEFNSEGEFDIYNKYASEAFNTILYNHKNNKKKIIADFYSETISISPDCHYILIIKNNYNGDKYGI